MVWVKVSLQISVEADSIWKKSIQVCVGAYWHEETLAKSHAVNRMVLVKIKEFISSHIISAKNVRYLKGLEKP